MGIFDLFRKKQGPAVQAAAIDSSDLLQPVEVATGVKLPKALASHWREIEKSKLSYISIKAIPGEQENFEQSGFGFLPCLPKGFTYPTDIEGNLMYPLAQINCSEIPVLAGFPNFGYLQFYISPNDTFGLDFTRQQAQDHWRVLYFDEDEVKDFETDFSFLQTTMNNDCVPLHKPHRLVFTVAEEYIGVGDVRSQEGGPFDLSKIINLYPNIAEELQEEIWDTFVPGGHKMGGYAYFTQSDPRSYDELLKDYILLLQINSDDEIMWGDCGVGNFFIHPADLAKKDFSKVMFNWDCS